ncbi:hypothetical protein COW57_03790 [Candidatus Roizmanbacteria bacterium CG17_big_fil_post_rev_8_21_14_2_50_39_7]|uniref:Aminotransferase n=3 Tax=Candidatus Roizmaniibacteriota TaxID=1752723 RepID=A0A2H0KMN0_9BACT|nr:MAG: hypothetical protein COV87_02140 [Candidatus Roizmanbacteria bacterium CG11_big_fil_rev_8_21_14_0_20_37_16]PIV08223.1 MAG: hypothetical protein COS52_03825 [Candidatus Roizmanbacteria bacterium CG03_land_8_20_14_0_80_39_12]PIV70706.1 MAG: hypothetical protein COW57_03790 [Candidatus Roizmanbacteria bacterium CG17_big_fil_post_rev_8_21_14_2_50_39_7]
MKNNIGNYTHQVSNPEKFLRFDLTEGDCWFKEKIAHWFQKIDISTVIHYPDEKIIHTKQLLARWLHMREENISIGQGSDELIEIIPQIFIKPKERALTVSPSFFRFSESSVRSGAEIITIPLDRKNSYEWNNTTIKRFFREAKDKQVKLIWLASPNNPTGIDIPQHILLDVIKLGKIIVIDKVLNGFTKEIQEISHLVWENPNLIVLSSFSKTFGLPGLRLGFAIGAPSIIKQIEDKKLPFNIAGPTLFIVEKLLQALLSGEVNMKGGLRLFQERIFLEAEIHKLKNIQLATQSRTNFILLKPTQKINLFKELLEKGILVTNLNKLVGIKNKNFVRVTVRNRKENFILLQALKEIDNHFH